MKNDFTVTVQEKIQNSSSALQSADVRYKPSRGPTAQAVSQGRARRNLVSYY